MDSQGPAVVRNLHHLDNVSGRRVDEAEMKGMNRGEKVERKVGGGGHQEGRTKTGNEGSEGRNNVMTKSTKQRKTQNQTHFSRKLIKNINYKEQKNNKS